MTYCNLSDRKRIEFLNRFTWGFIWNQGYVNPLYMDEFEEEAKMIIEKFRVNHNMGYLAEEFLMLFNFEDYEFISPEKLAEKEGKQTFYYNSANNKLNGSLRWRGHLKRMSKYMMFDEYDTEYARIKANQLKPYVFARDGVKCVKCSSEDELNVHHIRPLSKRGLSIMDNMITLCKPCHVEIHSKKDSRYLDIRKEQPTAK